ncbi:hypothetical protein AB1Y20_021533 [Prymnesium parvum]|uniref:Mono(ADP-ribosyl)transferase n=1 Tax=Prymnesium parvum TaxID=97485 RepID=A0AB34JLV6_PRYPA
MSSWEAEDVSRVEQALNDAFQCVIDEDPRNAICGIAEELLGSIDDEESVTESEAEVLRLRKKLQRAQQIADNAKAALVLLVPNDLSSLRSSYLMTLEELIGKQPSDVRFEEEWIPMNVEHYQLRPSKHIDPSWGAAEIEVYVRQHRTLETFLSKFRQTSIDTLIKRGWAAERARAYAILTVTSAPMSRALRERSPRYAASTYALCQAIYDSCADAGVAPMIYRHLRGEFSLSSMDQEWNKIETPDQTGFCGLVSTAVTVGDCEAANFSEKGYMRRFQVGQEATYVLEPSDIVGFTSTSEDEHGAHSAVLTYTDQTGVFPPNTLFRLKKIMQAGEWEAPGGVFPKQRLLIVGATYMRPSPKSISSAAADSKLCQGAATLLYGTRTSFVNGLSDLIGKPLLTMEQEFERDFTWTDWKGKSYNLRNEWAYVNGPAVPAENCTPGTRDADHLGKTPEQFLQIVNDHIRAQRAAGYGAHLSDLQSQLSLQELLGLRLYSGPCFSPINNFLRQLSSISRPFRDYLTMNPSVTFTATVKHIYLGIRKLAAVMSEAEARTPLYRGVRGKLPEQFWMGDDHGMVCAVEMAFMSTSRHRQTPIDYMEGSANVLWELAPMGESDVAYHCGADISMISQFAGEREVLFPPCTMLRVRGLGKEARDRTRVESITNNEAENRQEEKSRSATADPMFQCQEGSKQFLIFGEDESWHEQEDGESQGDFRRSERGHNLEQPMCGTDP